ncbi:hypothetical protein T10_5363 [Trichinella papuae]|uniref:Uncharacterized protein n=1 Tax=Trichinella papuae TaxID=268474 RepID=A0A0V1MBR3_9BILA|nr:hypothetical protein T10_5363 [Trichinella papuae]
MGTWTIRRVQIKRETRTSKTLSSDNTRKKCPTVLRTNVPLSYFLFNVPGLLGENVNILKLDLSFH